MERRLQDSKPVRMTFQKRSDSQMISIRARSVDWTDELREKVERSISFALDRYKKHVKYASVYLADVNGPKGGIDKICQITADLDRGSPVQILEKGIEIEATVNRAVDKLRYRIGRKLQRRKPAAMLPAEREGRAA
jgi:ribosome-associated translation inhibitor RaiA